MLTGQRRKMHATRIAIAVVEDDAPLRSALIGFLRALGFDARPYESAEALIGQPVEGINCILADHNLPGMRGLELAEYLRETKVEVPLILMTARDDPWLRQKCKDAGIALFIKPVDTATLNRAIAEVLAIRGSSI